MKMKCLELILLTFLISLSVQKYENSNLKKFLSNLGLPDIKETNQFLDEQDSLSNETIPTNSTDDEESSSDEEPSGDEDPSGDEEGEDSQEESKNKTYINIRCLWADKYNVYSLQFLQDDEKDYEYLFYYGKIIFNFCQNTNRDKQHTVIWEKNTTNKTEIKNISGSIDGDGNSKNEWMELNDDDGKTGLKIKLARGEICNEETKKYHQTYFKIYCDPDTPDSQFLEKLDTSEFNHDTCLHYITGYSIYGCALNKWYLLKRAMSDFWYIFSAAFILLGLFFVLWGYKSETVTLILVLGVIFCYLIIIIVLNFIPSLIDTEQKLFILIGAGFLAGSVIGFLLKSKITILFVLLGGGMGYSFAQFVYQIVQSMINWNPTYLYYATIAVCVVAGILVSLLILKSIIIFATSFLGGYIAMRGVSVIFGNYIDEGQFVDLIRNGEYEQLKELRNGWTFAYLGLWLVLTIFGVFYQCRGHKKSSNNNSTKNENNYSQIKS